MDSKAAHWERLLINPKKIPGGKKAKKGYVHSGILHLIDFTVNPAPSGGGGGGGGGAVAAPAGGDAAAAAAPAFVGTPQLGAEKVLTMTDGADLEIGKCV